MCRLFTIISKNEVSASPWFFHAKKCPFIEFSKKKINGGPHNSGWGIAYLKNDRWAIFKEGKVNVKKFNFDLINKIKSKITLIHLRHASVGSETTRNAHPFVYKNWAFIHNGMVDRDKIMSKLNDKFKKLISSDTDSEVLFYLIMKNFEETKEIIKAIKITMASVKRLPHKGLNFILSDGENVYVFRDVNRELNNKFDYYSLYYLQKKNEISIASDPLTEDDWKTLHLGELISIDKKLRLKKIQLF